MNKALLAPVALAFATLASACMPVLTPAAKPADPPAASSTETAPVASASTTAKASDTPADAAFSERTLELRGARFSASLSCKPSADKVDKEDTDSGPFSFRSFDCTDEANKLGYFGLVGRFDRALPASAPDTTREKKNAWAAKLVAKETCDAQKADGTKCEAGAARTVGDLSEVKVVIKGGESTIRVIARYPNVMVVGVMGAKPAQLEQIFASAKLPAP